MDDEEIYNNAIWKDYIDKKELEWTKNDIFIRDTIISTENLIKVYSRVEEYHKIYFVKNATDNIMDYSSFKYGFFDYQFEIITKLNDEFPFL